MKHIRFMTDNQKVCDNPERLELWDSPVIVDYEPHEDESCKLCPQLLIAHNERAFKKERWQRISRSETLRADQKPGVSKRAVLWGVVLSSVFYLFLFALVMWVFYG